MRLLVGTLYTIEKEFPACLAAIRRQTHRNYRHFVIRNLPNLAAHAQLYHSFMARADEFDLFVKIDADMVLQDTRFFEKVIVKFKAHPAMLGLIVAVHDHFSNRLIEGLHIYRSTIRWSQRQDAVFVDAANLPPGKIVYDYDDLAPAAAHCPDPSRFQAFHYGIHKGIKALAAYHKHARSTAQFHMDNIDHTWRHFLQSADARVGLACLGAEMALRGQFQPEHLNFDHPYPRMVLARYRLMAPHQIRRAVQPIRSKNWGLFTGLSRAEILVDGPLRYLARRVVPQPLHPTLSNWARSWGFAKRNPPPQSLPPVPAPAPADLPQGRIIRQIRRPLTPISTKTPRPVLTVLLPVKNAMPYLTAALQSLADQTFSRFSILAWDNGSTDGSIEELHKWIPHKLPGRVITDQPLGLGASLARMVMAAPTDLCARADADDINLRDRLSLQFNFLRSHPDVGVLGSNMQLIDEAGNNLLGSWHVVTQDADIRWRLRFCNAVNHPTVMFRRCAVLAAGNYRDLTPAQDYDLWLRLVPLTRFANLAAPLVGYRRHSASIQATHPESRQANHAIAQQHAALLFPGYSTVEAMHLRDLGMFRDDLPLTLPDIWLFRNAASRAALAVGQKASYFRSTMLFRAQIKYLTARWLKSRTTRTASTKRLTTPRPAANPLRDAA